MFSAHCTAHCTLGGALGVAREVSKKGFKANKSLRTRIILMCPSQNVAIISKFAQSVFDYRHFQTAKNPT
jgi:hypothetical protein